MKKRLLYVVLSTFLGMAVLWKGYDKLVDGFFPYRTIPPTNLPALSAKAPLSASLSADLNQPFYYLASGSQSFVFISADRQLILKLFKHHRWKAPFYASWLPSLTHYWTQKRLSGLLATYQSCLFCWEEFKEDTALIHVQLTPLRGDHIPVTFYNRLGKAYVISLENTAFVLQKYAEPVAERLLTLKAQGDLTQAQAAIDSLLNHLLHKRSKGFTDKDPNFLNNFGFVGKQAVSIDVGGLIRDVKKDNLYFCNKELKKVKKTLLPWLKKYYPELLPYTNQQIETTKQRIVTSI